MSAERSLIICCMMVQPYKRRAQAAKAERDRQMMAWEKTLTPDDVRQENAFRAAQRRDGRSRRANMKDPNAPKKPLSAYFMFLQRIRASPEMVREVFGEEVGTTKQSVLAAAKWRSMSDEEKKVSLSAYSRRAWALTMMHDFNSLSLRARSRKNSSMRRSAGNTRSHLLTLMTRIRRTTHRAR